MQRHSVMDLANFLDVFVGPGWGIGFVTGIQVLDRVVSILTCFSHQRPTLTANEIHALTGIPRSTVYRLVDALVQHGFLSYDSEARQYRIGFRVISLAGIALTSIELRRVALPYMRDFGARIKESVNLNIREGRFRVCIEKVEGSSELREISHVGSRTPLHAGASGKVLLAFAPPSVVEDYIKSAPLTPVTEHTTTDPDVLMQQLAEVRRQGYGVSVGERLLGAASVSAPIFDHTGSCVAALTISGPVFRFTEDVINEHLAEIVDGARQISLELGWHPITEVQT